MISYAVPNEILSDNQLQLIVQLVKTAPVTWLICLICRYLSPMFIYIYTYIRIPLWFNTFPQGFTVIVRIHVHLCLSSNNTFIIRTRLTVLLVRWSSASSRAYFTFLPFNIFSSYSIVFYSHLPFLLVHSKLLKRSAEFFHGTLLSLYITYDVNSPSWWTSVFPILIRT